MEFGYAEHLIVGRPHKHAKIHDVHVFQKYWESATEGIELMYMLT